MTEIECDCPPYYIVESLLKYVGDFKNPLDVRWCRVKNCSDNKGILNYIIEWLMPIDRQICKCSGYLVFHKYEFNTTDDKKLHYSLSQCSRCWSIYWEELPVPKET